MTCWALSCEYRSTPVVDFADGGGARVSGAQRDTGFKLLVYLQCCLRQQQFPPGAGPLPTAKGGIVKAGVLGDAKLSHATLHCVEAPAHRCFTTSQRTALLHARSGQTAHLFMHELTADMFA